MELLVITAWVLFGAVVGLAALGAVWGGIQWIHRDRVVVRRRVLVNLDTGRAFAGVLWCKTGDWLVLRNAEMMERGQAAVPVDGEVVLERQRVEFLQAL